VYFENYRTIPAKRKGVNLLEELLQRCTQRTGYTDDVVEHVIDTFLDEISSELSKGKDVNLGENFGRFIVRLPKGNVCEASSKTPKLRHYKAFFREGKALKKRLRLNDQEV
jgi:nucleoid DNA-binding protein